MFTFCKLVKKSFNAALLAFIISLAFSIFTQAQSKYKPLKGITHAGTVVNISSLPPASNFTYAKKQIPILHEPQYSKSVKQYQKQQANSSTLKASREEDKSTSQLFLPKAKAPLGKSAARSIQTATLNTNFQGIASTTEEPPDPIIAVGSNYIVEAVNSEIAIFNKSGVRQKTVQLTTLFNISTTPFDPRVIYDQYAQRWVVTALEKTSDFTQSNYEIAVSQTSDPTGSWYAFSSNAMLDGSTQTSYWADYDNLGYDNSAIYITSNQFTSTDLFEYAKIRIFNKSQLYNNQTLTYTDFVDMTDNYGNVFALVPAQNFGTTTSEYLLNTEEWGASSITVWRIDNQLNSPSLTQQAIINVASYSSNYPANLVKEEGTSLYINGGDSRAQQVIFNNGFLYTSFNTLYNWGSGTVEAIRYEKVDVNSNSSVIDALYGADGYYYFYPQIGIDNYGDIALVFNRSSSNEYPGVYMAYRSANDASASSSEALQAGAGTFTNSNALDKNGNIRWGDYSGIGLDPSSDNQLWFCGEWATNSNDWSTQIGSFKFVPVEFVNSVGGSSGGGSLKINSNATVNSGLSLRLGMSSNNTELTLAQGGTNQDRFVNTNNIPLAKHNNWNSVSSSYLLNNNFSVNGTPGETETANFISLNSATINAVSDAGNIQLQFNDPWYINSNGSQGNNYAQATAPITQTSAPMTGAYNQSSGGVFLNQGVVNGQWTFPYYSVGFPSGQSISVGGTSHQLYLYNWSTSGGVNIENSTAAQTGVEFTSGGATVTANVKGVHLSSDPSAFSNNSQRKLVRTKDGWLHQVYTSLGHVWLEESTDNGTTWFLGNNGQPLDSGSGKCPSIDWHYNTADPTNTNYYAVVVAFEQQSGSTYTIEYDVFTNSGGAYVKQSKAFPGPLYTEPSGGDQYAATNANPNIAWAGNNDPSPFVLSFERKSTAGGMQPGIYWIYGYM